MSRQCKACGKSFQPHQKVPDQQYCSSTICQRERRRLWQQEKRRLDADYRENDSRQIRVYRLRLSGHSFATQAAFRMA